MSDEIKKAIRTRLQQAGLTEGHLDDPHAHVVASDGQALHVLLKEGLKVEELVAELRDPQGNPIKGLEVKENDEWDLGELGKWRDFAIQGVGDLEKAAELEQPPELHFFAKGADGVAPEKRFHATMWLPFAIYEVLREQELYVRPVPTGERGGREFVEVTPEGRGVLKTLLGQWFDDTVSAQTMLAAAEAWRELQDKVYSTGVIGPLTLGLAPQRPEVPVSRVDGREAMAQAVEKNVFGLSARVTDFLERKGIALPERAMNAQWAEETLDQVTEFRDTPDEVVAELRKLFREQKDKKANAKAAMFGGPVPAANAPKAVNPGELRIAQAEAIKFDRLQQALEKLEVPEGEVRRLARELAIAGEPRKFPSVLFFAGPRHSAAEKMLETTIEMIGKKPLELDLAEPGFAAVFGHYKGVPTQADAALSDAVMNKTRGNQAAHLAIVVPSLEQVGSAANDPQAQREALVSWLEQVDEMLRTGTVESFARGGKPIAERKTSSLANSIFVFGWRRDPEELRALLAENPNLKHLAAKIFSASELEPGPGVANLVNEVSFRLRQHYGPKGAEVKLSPEVEKALVAAFTALGSTAAHDRFAEKLFVETYLVAKEHPAREYVVHFSGGLTAKDKARIAAGEQLQYANNLFGIEPK